MNYNKLILLLFAFSLLSTGCKVTFNEEEAPPEVKQLFFKGEQTLNDILNDGNEQLHQALLTLPTEFENDFDRANNVCLPDGSLDLLAISFDETVQEKLSPFFQFYCDARSKYHQGIAKNISLTKSFSCVVALGKLLIYDLKGSEKKAMLSFSEAKKCFSDNASKDWFEKNIEIDSNKQIVIKLKELPKTDNGKFSHIAYLNTNNFEASIRFRVHKNMSGALIEYHGQESLVAFGVSTTYLDGQFILRYDLMAQNFLNRVVNRSRLFMNLKKYDDQVLVEDLDFWRLSSNQTEFSIDIVNGGRKYGYQGSRQILKLLETGPEYFFSSPLCVAGETCILRDIKLPSREKIYSLGAWENTKESIQKVVEDNMVYSHTNAHFGLTPNLKKPSWEIIEGPLGDTRRSFMGHVMDKEFAYFSGGKKYLNGEFIDSTDAIKLNLKNLYSEKISIDEIPFELIPQVGVRRYSGVYKNNNLSFEFGGFDHGVLVKSGELKKGESAPVSLETLFSNNGLSLSSLNIYPVFSPVVVFTGQHIIVYGGLGYTQDHKMTFAESGFVIDVEKEKAWMMNMAGAPKWITKGVWADDRLLAWGGYEISYKNLYPQIIPHNRGASYHLGTNSWSHIPSGPLAPRFGHQLVWANDRLVIFSGQDSIGELGDLGAKHVPGAAIFTPGESTKIYFTEESKMPMNAQVAVTDADDGEFYLDGDFNLDSIIEVYHGESCEKSNLGMIPSANKKYFGFGKMKIKFRLMSGDNWVSVLIKNGAEVSCSNALNFVK